jgi:hypothetical protein
MMTMSISTKLRPLVFLVSAAALSWLVLPLDAKQDQGAIQNNAATFRSVPIASPYYPTSLYGSYYGPYGGYLAGAANVISSQGQMQVDQQQAVQMLEQTKSMRLDNRRKSVQEYLYERNVMPTAEDERERMRIEQIRHSRNDAAPTEIWSGKALNNLLQAIAQQDAKQIKGPMIPLEESTITHINFTTGASSGSLGLLRDGGKVRFPIALEDGVFDENRKALAEMSLDAYKQAQEGGTVDGRTIRGMSKATDKLRDALRRDVDDLSPNEYIEAKRFLDDMDSTIKALQDPNVGSMATRRPKGATVGDFTGEMLRQGLKFAPAVSGDEAAYTAMHRAMVAYYQYDPSRPWDPAAK